MKYQIVNIDDLRWLLGHTGGFRGGYVTDVQVSKRRLLDEASGREVPAGTTVTVVIRYRIRQMSRVAKLTMTGVTDFSIFEQEGADCSTLGVIQTELTDGKLRFLVRSAGRTLCGVRRSAVRRSGGAEPRTVVAESGGSMDVSKRGAGLADGHMALGGTGRGGCSLYLAGHGFVLRASSIHTVGGGFTSRRRFREQWVPQGSTVCCTARLMGLDSAWCFGSVGCRIAAPVRCSRFWRTDRATVLRPVFGGRYDHSRRGMAELEVIRTAPRG